jgi:multiple sugar transport system permease protein
MKPSPAARALRTIVIVVIAAWSLGPVAIGVLTSISSQNDVQAVPARWWPHQLNLDAYRAIVGGVHSAGAVAGCVGCNTTADAGAFGQSLLSSVEVTAEATLATLVVSVVAGYALSRLRFRGNKVLLWAVVGTLVIPLFTLVVALFRMMVELHLINTQLGLVLVYLSAEAPLAMWLLYNHCRDLPPEPEEAALMDGCTRWQAFRMVVLPQMRSGIAALAAIVMLLTYGQFLIPLLLGSTPSTTPVTVLITEFVGKYTTNYPILAAAGVIAVLPPAIIALLLNRHIRGMLSGATG